MRRSVLLAIASSLLLAGCVSMSPAERRAADETTCRSYGFRPRTAAFAECLQRLDLDRNADRRARLYGDRAFDGGFGIGVGRYGGYW
ncbi:hypothetical protein [Aureimonas leprariae]|uniref:Lipoprotein n=1 Tax=Plantimonas leprariae TaxID=2615207 RepID=A0A7V7TYN3_9HYPH|nr:hypothetical protein [Aureimonas leprariae]KAB0682966.1 hypothetical protein F6X38_02490 [Aureimonas leprariae]